MRKRRKRKEQKKWPPKTIFVEGTELRVIPGHEGYAINCDGTKVWELPYVDATGKMTSGRWVPIFLGEDGYATVNLEPEA